MNIMTALENIREEDQRLFLSIRTSMRKAYMQAITATVGVNSYQPEDDTFLDAIDIKVEMLMKRAGIETPNSENNQPDENASDMFAIITRPVQKVAATKLPDNEWRELNHSHER